MPYTPDPCEWQHPCKTNWKQEKGLCFEVSSAVDESLQASKWTWCGCFEFVDIAKAVNMHPVSLVAPYSGNQSGPNNPSNNVAQEHIAYNLDSLSVQLVIGNHRRHPLNWKWIHLLFQSWKKRAMPMKRHTVTPQNSWANQFNNNLSASQLLTIFCFCSLCIE